MNNALALEWDAALERIERRIAREAIDQWRRSLKELEEFVEQKGRMPHFCYQGETSLTEWVTDQRRKRPHFVEEEEEEEEEPAPKRARRGQAK
jgi:hypothetical protein